MGGVADLLGHATMPPRWALGYLQSSRHFESPKRCTRLAAQLREKRLPCDALDLSLDLRRRKGLEQGLSASLEFEPAPVRRSGGDARGVPASRISASSATNIRSLHPASPLFARGRAVKATCSTAPIRCIRPAARARQLQEGQRYLDFARARTCRRLVVGKHRHLVDLGVAGWWLDGGEGPTASAVLLAAGPARHPAQSLRPPAPAGVRRGRGGDNPDRRPFLLCRSGGPGMQRFGAVPWSGDVNTTWETFETQIRTRPQYRHVGRAALGDRHRRLLPGRAGPGELFARWFQFGAFCSIFRAHGHVLAASICRGRTATTIEAICRKYLELRYQLMPYTYTLAWQAHRNGLPLMRPLVLNYPDDPRRWDLGTQYLWGDDLLVAPVTPRRRDALAGLSAGRHLARFLDARSPRGAGRRHGRGAARPAAAVRARRRDRAARSGRAILTASARSMIDRRWSTRTAASAFTLYEDDGDQQRLPARPVGADDLHLQDR